MYNLNLPWYNAVLYFSCSILLLCDAAGSTYILWTTRQIFHNKLSPRKHEGISHAQIIDPSSNFNVISKVHSATYPD